MNFVHRVFEWVGLGGRGEENVLVFIRQIMSGGDELKSVSSYRHFSSRRAKKDKVFNLQIAFSSEAQHQQQQRQKLLSYTVFFCMLCEEREFLFVSNLLFSSSQHELVLKCFTFVVINFSCNPKSLSRVTPRRHPCLIVSQLRSFTTQYTQRKFQTAFISFRNVYFWWIKDLCCGTFCSVWIPYLFTLFTRIHSVLFSRIQFNWNVCQTPVNSLFSLVHLWTCSLCVLSKL